MQELLIIDIQKNIDIKKKRCHVIHLSSGTIKLSDVKHIYLKSYQKKYYDYFKNILIKKLQSKVNKINNEFLYETEVFNLRNDKELFINKLINILILKKLFIKKKIIIKIITDNYFTKKVFEKLGYKVEYYGKNKKKFNLIFLKIIKFYLKTLIVLTLLKIKKKNKLSNKFNNIYLSLYPNFYKDTEETFFNKKKDPKLNFLLADETLSNLSFLDIIFFLKKKTKYTLHAESFIKFSDILKLILFLPTKFYKIKGSVNQQLVINNCDFSDFFQNYFQNSIVNRFKLEIYNNSLERIFKTFNNIKKFHFYMFEYHFGFYLTRILKSKFKKLELIGYQHGIFSDRLMWLDILKLSHHKKKHLPHKIIALNNFCLLDYKKKLNFLNIRKNKQKKSNEIIDNFKSDKSKSNILVLPGTHDVLDIYNLINNNLNKSKKSIYYFKLHPKNKFFFNENKQIKIIKNINRYSFSSMLISQTSTLIYDCLINKIKFNFISYDFRPNIVSSKIPKKYEFYLN
jgi:hypothetical protein